METRNNKIFIYNHSFIILKVMIITVFFLYPLNIFGQINKESLEYYFGRDTRRTDRIERFFTLNDCEKLDLLDSSSHFGYDSSKFYKFPLFKKPAYILKFDIWDTIIEYLVITTNYDKEVYYGFGGRQPPLNSKDYLKLSNEWRKRLGCKKSTCDTSTQWHGKPIDFKTTRIYTELLKYSNCEKLDSMVKLYYYNPDSNFLLFGINYFEEKTKIKTSAKQGLSGFLYRSEEDFNKDIMKWKEASKCQK